MLFNSFSFAVFLPIVFAAYWWIGSRRWQNALLLVASYVFYGWWDWRFLTLIAVSSCVDYVVGRALYASVGSTARRGWLTLSLATNLGLLGFFKYFNFFADSLAAAFASIGYELSTPTLQLVLPVGISFYTFQTLSYSLDIYHRKMKPTRDPVAFFAFVAFFPQLVAGPIERASNLIPQFESPRRFDPVMARDGMRQILWGLFKKVVVADAAGLQADQIFSASSELGGSTLILGAFYFSIQIYGDFSGYSDIAIGIGRLFGFRLMRNFAYPYFSRDIAEFWRRWHISLSTWFRDYVYVPMGGSRVSKGRALWNITFVFLVSGLWHGANWTFVVWGTLNALYFAPLFLTGANRRHVSSVVARGRIVPTLREAAGVASTFLLTMLAWVFFRADSVTHAFQYLAAIPSPDLLAAPAFVDVTVLGSMAFLLGAEWLQREREHGLDVEHIPRLARHGFYILLVALVFRGFGAGRQFIYFQF